MVRRERWGLSLAGKLLLLIGCLVAALAVRQWVYPFLAVTDRADGEILVVEGWVPTYSLKEAAAEFSRGHYQRAVIVRVVDDELGDKYESGRYNGNYIADLLVQNGVPAESLETIFCSGARKDRTYAGARSVKRWLAAKGIAVQTMEVATLGPHARRSRLLYEKAFDSGVKIGVVALQDLGYDPTHWWQSSEGVREVIGETLAYGYARFFFFPKEASK